MAERRRSGAWTHQACACREWCGDVPEDADLPTAVCKGLRTNREPLVEVVLVHRDDLRSTDG